MTRDDWKSLLRKDAEMSDDEIANAVERMMNRKAQRKSQVIWPWIVTVALVLFVGFTGWDYHERRTLTDHGVEKQSYIRLLAFDLPSYKSELIPDDLYAKQVMQRAGVEFDPEKQVIRSVRNGKIVADSYDPDLEKQRSVSNE